MSNRFGYRVAYDPCDGEHYVENQHGQVQAGPFATEQAGQDWIAEFVDRCDRLREANRAQQTSASKE